MVDEKAARRLRLLPVERGHHQVGCLPVVNHLEGAAQCARRDVIHERTPALGRWRRGRTKAECPFKDADTMPWHPDVPNDETHDPARPPRPTRLTFNVPLVDINDANGPMEIVPGSHRMHHRGAQDYIYDLPQIYGVKILLRRGDAMLRDGNALHRGTPNLTERPRLLLDQ